jgi:hypothetical protein
MKRFNLNLEQQIQFMNHQDPIYFNIHTQKIIMVKYLYDNTNMGPDIIKMIMDYYETFIRNKKIHYLFSVMNKHHTLYGTGYYDNMKMKEINECHKIIDKEFKTKKPNGKGKNGSIVKEDKLLDIKHSQEFKAHSLRWTHLYHDSVQCGFWDKIDKKYIRKSTTNYMKTIKEEKEKEEMDEWMSKAPEFIKNTQGIDNFMNRMVDVIMMSTHNGPMTNLITVKKYKPIHKWQLINVRRPLTYKLEAEKQGLKYDII